MEVRGTGYGVRKVPEAAGRRKPGPQSARKMLSGAPLHRCQRDAPTRARSNRGPASPAPRQPDHSEHHKGLELAKRRMYVSPMRASPLLLGLIALAVASSTAAQTDLPPPPPDTTAARYGSSTALAFHLTEYGLGAGATGRTRLTDDLSIAVELGIGAGRDEREQRFLVGFFGESVIPFKRNYVLLAPLHIGLEQRLFRRTVEDNFRPFVHASIGPTLALQWPYFEDRNADGRRDEGEETLGVFQGLRDAEPRLGIGGTVAVGAAFGRGRTMQSIRFGLGTDIFPGRVDLLEDSPEVESPSRQAFWTPVVSFHVGRLTQ